MDPREQVQSQINEAVNSIKNSCDCEPEIGIILGSGLAKVAEDIDVKASIDYDKIPHFPLSTTEGHPGRLVLGTLSNKKLALMQGRFHFYEGYTMWGITFAVRVLASLGIKKLIITGACGSLNNDYRQGDLVLLEDHINLMPANPLIGPHVDEMGPRFIDMSEPYSKKLLEIAEKAAKQQDLNVKKGIYASVAGPQYETPAEVTMLRKLGADIVGMSIASEVIVAKQMGLDVLGITVVSNEHGAKKAISHKKVLENVGQSRASFVKLLQVILKNVN
ncbi:hypothetical protein LCGC14_0799870 [marine sediment metagenome]|uniref:purine-nucleoside phosphorylase n=1 Tax=marine sediment metagenome TaxID=412755 RepID=A0A0F9Q9W0_9ZZZZ